jgi:hypothetical protein
MVPATVWFSSFAPTFRAAQVRDALRAAGVRLLPYEADAASGPGILVFERVAAPVCEFVRSASRNGLDRVLAVGISRQAVAGDGPWPLLASGAADVFAWDHSACPVDEVLSRLERWKAVDRLVESPLVRHNLVGAGPVWTALLRRVVEVASFTSAPVLLAGDSGTGKELVARLIHSLDPRPRKRDLVVLDCTTIVPELSGSEFFGHERGAYTGAAGPRDGAFALSDGGTLFLD